MVISHIAIQREEAQASGMAQFLEPLKVLFCHSIGFAKRAAWPKLGFHHISVPAPDGVREMESK